MASEKPMAFEVESASLEGVSSLDAKMHGVELTIRAKDGADLEHNLSPWEAVKAYPMAIFWALLVSMCVIMEGYDTILIGNFYAYPTFAKKYGTYFPEVGYQLTAAWQAGLGNASGIGAFFGVLINGYLVGRYGQKVCKYQVFFFFHLLGEIVGFASFGASKNPTILIIQLWRTKIYVVDFVLLLKSHSISNTDSRFSAACTSWLTRRPVGLHLHHLLRAQHRSSHCWRSSLRPTMGCFRNNRSCIRLGGASSFSPSILDIVHQYVLHYRAVDRCWRT